MSKQGLISSFFGAKAASASASTAPSAAAPAAKPTTTSTSAAAAAPSKKPAAESPPKRKFARVLDGGSDDFDDADEVVQKPSKRQRVLSTTPADGLADTGSLDALLDEPAAPAPARPILDHDDDDEDDVSGGDGGDEVMPEAKPDAKPQRTVLDAFMAKKTDALPSKQASTSADRSSSAHSNVSKNAGASQTKSTNASSAASAKDADDDKDQDDISVSEEDEEGSDSDDDVGPAAAEQAKHVASKFTTKRFDPVADAMWKRGQATPYLAVARSFAEMEETTKRLEITEALTQLLRSVLCISPEDLLSVIYLCTNSLGPTWEGLKLEIGESILQKSIAETTGRTLQRVKEEYGDIGDLGLLAERSRGTQKTMFAPAPLTVPIVLKKFITIAQLSGNATQQKKRDIIKTILVSCREQEARYAIRSLQGKLRIGLASKTVLCALAHACVLSPPVPSQGSVADNTKAPIAERSPNGASSMRPAKLEESLTKANEIIRSVFAECPNWELIVNVLLRHPIEELREHLKLAVGSPVNPMLAQPTRGIGEVIQRLEGKEFTCEYKYDGERAQVHLLEDGSVRIFSRNLEDHTTKYPDIISFLPNAIFKAAERPTGSEETWKPATSFILDCECVAYDRVEKRILPFQVLSTRSKKNVDVKDVKVTVSLFAFDLLYLNGDSLLRAPLRERRDKLRSHFREVEGEFSFAIGKDSNDPEEIQELLTKAIEDSTEGLMVKTLDVDSTYEPSRRSYSWLKVKKDYLEGMGDSLDLVVIGAYKGHGKRTGVFGGYLLACYDDESEQYQTICRIGTGFTDEQLESFTTRFQEFAIPKPKPYYVFDETNKKQLPDVWLDAKVVFEVLCADMSISPKHKAAAGLVDPIKGIALRFPRLIRERTDKNPEQATTAEQVADMYQAQAVVSSGNHGAGKR